MCVSDLSSSISKGGKVLGKLTVSDSSFEYMPDHTHTHTRERERERERQCVLAGVDATHLTALLTVCLGESSELCGWREGLTWRVVGSSGSRDRDSS